MVVSLCPIIFLCCSLGSPRMEVRFQDEKIYTVSEVSVKPEPIAGTALFQKKWSRKVVYPPVAVSKDVQGMVYIQFIVNKDGSIEDASVRSGIGYGCDEAALKVFNEISEDAWKPGLKNGQPVKVKMVLPFYFKIIQG